jgi:hypothetical protein
MSRGIIYNEVMNLSYRASLTILYREELSQRFCNFISRIGIPTSANETELLTTSLRAGVFPKSS